MPKPSTVYKMKEAYIRVIFNGVVKRCATKCGNKFRYFSNSKSHVNMECMRCGYKFHTRMTTFDERYEEDTDGLLIKDPNLLFKWRKNS